MDHDLLHSLNALAGASAESERFAVKDGLLAGFADANGERVGGLLPLLRKAIAAHIAASRACAAEQGRLTFGIEIGTDVAKLFGKLWFSAGDSAAIVDVKLRLTRLSQMRDPLAEYPAQVEAIVGAFHSGGSDLDFGWLVPPADIDFDMPRRVRAGVPASMRDVTYVYATQGAREAQSLDPRLIPSSLRVLTGGEEGLLMYAAIVPQEYAVKAGTMAIEIGSGSTELILAGAQGEKHTLAFTIAGDAQTGIEAIVRGIETNDVVAQARRYLQTDPAAAASFVRDARRSRAGGALFMNPNRASAAFRKQSTHHPINVAWAAEYGASNALDKYAPKAKILAALAQAFGFTVIHEGVKGGLKKAFADFIARAMTET